MEYNAYYFSGPGVLQGDSGGGLLIREGNLFYLRGIVSLKQPTKTALATFTDLADHIEWILAVRNEIEEGLLNGLSTLPVRGVNKEEPAFVDSEVIHEETTITPVKTSTGNL